ncbi:MAG: Tail sheath [uncultured bacterium]|nr:MAG: Tail sheath [uncultured bacterium]
MSTILNAAPMTNMLGTQDLSTRQLPVVPEAIPQHLPKVYVYAQKGKPTPQLVSGADMTNTYGIDSFDLRKPWTTHATVLANLINAQGNAIMMERVIPADAGPVASIALYLDVLPTEVPVYARNLDGSFQLDQAGQPVATGGTVPGFRVKWVTDTVKLDAQGNSLFGAGQVLPGDQTDLVAGTQSQRYPIADVLVSSQGSYGNNLGLRLWAPTSKSPMPIDDRLIVNEKAYPFRMSCVSRPDAITTPSTVVTMFAEQFVNVTFRPNTINRVTDSLASVHDVFISAYQDLNNPVAVPHYGPFDQMRVYDANVQQLLAQFHAAELPFINGFSDFTGDVDEEYRFNFVSGMSSHGVPYTAFQVVADTVGSVRLSENTTIYAKGGSDGTMNEILFGALVAERVSEYGNINSVLLDDAKYPEAIMYDSGFPLATKHAMANFIALRKDTAVVLSTHDTSGPVLSASEESSLAIALRTRLQMFPESEFYGTSTMRAMIVGRSGFLQNSQYRKRLPLTLEIATKAAKYMGSGNGKWKPNFSFDSAPNNNVTMFNDVNVTYTPAAVRNKDWVNGLVWVDSYDRRSLYFPALKTVYDNDTSVLNSFFTMMACVELEKVGSRARRRFSGVSSLTDQQLIERVNTFVSDNTNDRFDGRFVIKPDAYFTAADTARGFSWSLAINIYAPNMKTVMTLSIVSRRIGDLAQAV